LIVTAQAAAASVSSLASKRKLDFVADLQPSTGHVFGDARRLQQMIEHLLRHAIAGTREGGRILLRVDGTAAAVRLIVSDDGIGMTKQMVERAFDRFGQPGITRNGERALGLGLPLARQFVEAHGGEIELMSEPGRGTVIRVRLPRR